MAKKTLPIENISLPRDKDNKIIYSTGDPATYGALINNLYQRVEGLKKTVSYLDFYNISDAVTNEITFSEQLNKLPLNQSLVINTAPFQHGGVSYSTGDILTKTNSNEILHIKAQTGGVFFPESITATLDENQNDIGNYTIQFAYQGSSPTEKNNTIETINTDNNSCTWKSSFAQTITYTGLTSASNSEMYSVWADMKNKYIEFDQIFVGGTPINPFVQFFFNDNNIPGEQVYIDYTLESINSKWKISINVPDFTDAISPIWIKVK